MLAGVFQEVVDHIHSGKAISSNKGNHLSGRERLRVGISFSEVVKKGKTVVGTGGHESSAACYGEDGKKVDLFLHEQRKHAKQMTVFSKAARVGESAKAFERARFCMASFRKRLLGLREELDHLIWSLDMEGAVLGPVKCSGQCGDVVGGLCGIGISGRPGYPAGLLEPNACKEKTVGPSLVIEAGLLATRPKGGLT